MNDNVTYRHTSTGAFIYMQLLDGNKIWNKNNSTWVDIVEADWDNYAITMTEKESTKIYEASVPSAVAAGSYSAIIYQRSGGSPAVSDSDVGSIEQFAVEKNFATLSTELQDRTGGSGGISWTYIAKDAATGDPLDGVAVWVTSDSSGANTVAGSIFTNTFGQAGFMLDAGTYYFWKQLSGYDFDNPEEVVVS